MPRKNPKPTGDAESTEAGAVTERNSPLTFPVVGVGASAGGLQALTQLLHALPAEPNLALIVVQHLDPTHKSFLSDILSRSSDIAISEVQDEMTVEPNRVYVIPSGTTMQIAGGILRLLPRTEARGLHRPIDHFLRSLAEDQGHQAIGVILSGTATDGTLGLNAIKAEGGITFAQDHTAEYESMPRSAIAAGCVDLVLPPDAIAKELIRIARHPYVAPAPGSQAETEETEQALRRIVERLHAGTGVDFTNYKRSTLHRRIGRRVVLHKLTEVEEYSRLLQETPNEVEALYQDILINVTSFFRNPEAFEALKAKVFPALTADRTRNEPVRIWVLGCSTGEEVYSIAMAYTEYLEALGRQVPAQLFATDLNGNGVEKARAGLYSKSIAQDVSPERLRRFFVESDGSYRISKQIRDMCVFARHNVLREPAFSRMDMVSCRNLLIYFDSSAQQRIVPTLHYALQPNGFLWLGSSETIGPYRDLFEVEDLKHRIYSKRPGPGRSSLNPAGVQFLGGLRTRRRPEAGNEIGARGSDVQKEAERLLIAQYAPPSVLVDLDFDILQFRGETGTYLAPAPGKASLNLLKMLREGLLVGLRSALQKAKREGAAVRVDGLQVKSNGGHREVNIHVVPVKGGKGAEGGLLVLFEEPGQGPREQPTEAPLLGSEAELGQDTEKRDIRRLEQELAATREYLHSVIEQQEASNEELQSASEEVQSANEELQSINEELETSKEEIEASNEELATLNDELQNRNLELGQTINDLHNLFSSVHMAIVMLGRDLRIRRFTPDAEKLLHLISADVGRRISDAKLHLDVPDLEEMLTEVIETVSEREREVRDKTGRWYSLRLRPYRTSDNRIDGAVLLLVDVDALKHTQEILRRQAEMLEQAHEPILMMEFDGTLTYWNRGAEETYGYSRDEAVGAIAHELLRSSADRRAIREALERQGRWAGEVVQTRRDGVEIVIESRILLLEEADGARLVLETHFPITERKRMEQELRQRADELIAADRRKDVFLAMLAHELRNPLASMCNAVELIKSPTSTAAVLERSHDMMGRQVRNMARMIDDLLEVSRMTRGKVQIRSVPVDVATILERAIDLNRVQIDQRAQVLAFSPPDAPVWVTGDSVRLEQVISNLIHNASKFSPREGHIAISITTSAPKLRTRVVAIHIQDDGIGISEDLLPQVFDLFVQGDHSLDRAQGGLGIGLTLARYLVELHGGRIEAHSEGLGHGSEFTVHLPRMDETAVLGLSTPVAAGERATQKAKRILVVDDSVDGADSLAMLLHSAGHVVEVAYDGPAALDTASTFCPEVVILDIGLPGMDGYDVASELRRRSSSAKALVIGLSGYDGESDRRQAREAGFDHHLTKPVDFADLREILSASAPSPESD